MKSKIVLLLILFLTTARCPAQTFTFPLHKGNIWQYKEPPPPPYDYDVIEARALSDTLMSNGLEYTLISWYNYGYASSIWNHYYRQVGDTVFEYLPNGLNNGATNEVIRYNFAKTLDDTVTSYTIGGDTIITTVFDQGTMSVSGVQTAFKTYYIRYKQSTMFWIDKITDGIGLIYQEVEAGFELSLVGSIIDSVRLGTILGAPVSPSPVPTAYNLFQNYPNPFNPSTTIRYGLPSRSHATLAVYNILGQQIVTLVNETQEAGYHEVRFEGSGLASGVYFYRIQAGSYIQTRKLLLVR